MPAWMNEGTLDRTLRVLLGLGLLSAGWFGVITGTPGLLLKVFGFVPLLTGLAGWCPLYAVLGIRTCPARAPLR